MLTPAAQNHKLTRRRKIIICALLFLFTLSISLLGFQDNRLTAKKIMAGVTTIYRNDAQYLLDGNIDLFLRGPDPPSDANVLAHPPGYPIFMAAVFSVFGNSDAALQVAQIICHALAAVIVFLIAYELLSYGIALIAAILVSLSPQLSFYSLLLLPDSLSAIPILGTIYLLILASRRHPFRYVIAAGALLGVSCWLRSNGLLLALWLVVIIPFLFPRGRRLQYAGVLVAAMIITIAPITIRNVVVFGHFIPLSLGSGITLLQGVAEYDKNKRFGLPATDEEVALWERDVFNCHNCLTIYAPNGIERDRNRFDQGLAVIKSHPFWFFGVMLRRATEMTKYERVPTISTVPNVTHPLIDTDEVQPTLSIPISELKARGQVVSDQAETSLSQDGQTLRVVSDNSNWGDQIISPPIIVQKDIDYLLEIPVKVEQGRSRIKVIDAASDLTLGSSAVPDPLGLTKPDSGVDGSVIYQVPFVNGRADQIHVVLSNEDPHNIRPITQLGEIKLFSLGSGSLMWTRYLRIPIHFLQRFFLTAWLLPLLIFGITKLVISKQYMPLAVLFSVPAYYLLVQSIFHTESRYVLAMQYFNFVVIAVILHWVGSTLAERSRELIHHVQNLRNAKSV